VEVCPFRRRDYSGTMRLGSSPGATLTALGFQTVLSSLSSGSAE